MRLRYVTITVTVMVVSAMVTSRAVLRRFLAAAGLVLSVTSCNDTVAPRACEGTIAVLFQNSDGPRFDWSPSCGISALSVSTVAASPADAQQMWGFSVPESQPVGPFIRYGVNPPGATVWVDAQPLQPGTQYVVSVWLTIGGDVVVAYGETTFTWYPLD